MPEQKKQTAKQHFVPQYYLKRFSESKDFLFVYNKVNGKIYQSSIKDIAVQNRAYDTRWIDSPMGEEYLLENRIENHLSRIESKQALFIRDLIRRLNMSLLAGGAKMLITPDDKEQLQWFVSLMIMRNPFIMNAFHKNPSEVIYDDELSAIKDLVESARLGRFDSWLEHGQKIALTNGEGEGMVRFLKDNLEHLNPRFVFAEAGLTFVTCSNPVAYWMEGESDDEIRFSSLHIPLSPKFMLNLTEREDAPMLLPFPREGVDRLNYNYADLGHKHVKAVYSAKKGVLEDLKLKNTMRHSE